MLFFIKLIDNDLFLLQDALHAIFDGENFVADVMGCQDSLHSFGVGVG